MILLVICLVFTLITVAVFEFEYFFNSFIKFLFGSSLFMFWKHDFKLVIPKSVNVFKENIYSLNNGDISIQGHFVLGSGSVGSNPTYSYFIKNEDGSKERKSVTSDRTKIFEGNYEQPYFEETSCQNGLMYSFSTGLYEDNKDDICEKRIERKLFVPNKTVVLEFGVK